MHVDLADDTTLTELSCALLEGWAAASGDPDTPLLKWLRYGAPAGIDEHPEAVGVFPMASEPPSREFPLTSFDEGFANYISMEDSPHGEAVLADLVRKKYIKIFNTLKEAQEHVGSEDLTMNKLALITTEREGTLKHRLILDCRVSGTNSSTTKHERIVLPRIGDLIRDALILKKMEGQGKKLHFLVVDFEDAFYKVPLIKAEQRYFCVYYKKKWYVWSRVGQGSLNGPTLFGRLSAFVGRLSQALMSEDEGRLEIYCDDPVATILATE